MWPVAASGCFIASPLCGLAPWPVFGACSMHTGLGPDLALDLAASFPLTDRSYEDGDAAPFTVSGTSGQDLGFVRFTMKFKYLGPIAQSSLMSDADVHKRTRSAAAAFVALQSALCNFALQEIPRGKASSVVPP